MTSTKRTSLRNIQMSIWGNMSADLCFINHFGVQRLLPPLSEEDSIISRPKVQIDLDKAVYVHAAKVVKGLNAKRRHRPVQLPSRRMDSRDIDFHNRGLNNRPLEQRFAFIARRMQMTQDISRSSGFTKQRDIVWVSSEIRDKPINPFEGFSLITETYREPMIEVIRTRVTRRKQKQREGGKSEALPLTSGQRDIP